MYKFSLRQRWWGEEDRFPYELFDLKHLMRRARLTVGVATFATRETSNVP